MASVTSEVRVEEKLASLDLLDLVLRFGKMVGGPIVVLKGGSLLSSEEEEDTLRFRPLPPPPLVFFLWLFGPGGT